MSTCCLRIYKAQDEEYLPLNFDMLIYSDPCDPGAVARCMPVVYAAVEVDILET